jgi:hypothetical protein
VPEPNAGPDTEIRSAPVGSTFDRYATIEFESPDAADGFECRLGDANWQGCQSPTILTELELGAQRFEVRATGGGAADLTPASAEWTIVSVFGAPGAPVASGMPTPDPDPDGGSFRIQCAVSHFAYDDPIVSPGSPGAAHLHMFMGNEESDFSSTVESMFTTGEATCHGSELNRSSYWTPSLLAPEFDAGGAMVVRPDGAPELRPVLPSADLDNPHIYYKSGSDELSAIEPMPYGLRMIVGDASASGPIPEKTINIRWSCESWPIDDYLDFSQSIPACAIGDRVALTIAFPPCWNGVDLDSPDHQSHMSEVTFTQGRGIHCSASHPVTLPKVSYNMFFPVTAESAGPEGDSRWWRLASDRYAVDPDASPGGYSLHADWFMAWHPEVMEAAVEFCIGAGRSCSDGDLGNGWRLAGVVAPAITYPEDVRQVSMQAHLH